MKAVSIVSERMRDFVLSTNGKKRQAPVYTVFCCPEKNQSVWQMTKGLGKMQEGMVRVKKVSVARDQSGHCVCDMYIEKKKKNYLGCDIA